MNDKGPNPQFIASMQAALEYFKRLEDTGDIAQLDRERQNITLVIELGLSRPETRIPALEALIGSFQLLYARGYWREGLETFAKALQVCPDDRPDLKVELLDQYATYTLGLIHQQEEDYSAAEAVFRDGIATAQRNEDPFIEAYLQRNLGKLYLACNRPDAAQPPLQSALDLFTRMGLEREVAETEKWLR